MIAQLKEMGAGFVQIPLSRTGTNPFKDWQSIWRMRGIIRQLQPNLVFAYTPKAVALGAIATGLAGRIPFWGMITGVGYALTPGLGWRRKLARWGIKALCRWGAFYTKGLIFQNPDDLNLFREGGLTRSAVPLFRVYGSGVDVGEYLLTASPQEVGFLLVGRVIREKGVLEYFAAAEKMREDARFVLVGGLDKNPTGLQEAEVKALVASSQVEYAGSQKDVRTFLARSAVFVLPSYAEGTPRSALEAMSMGRGVVTANAPGCRETIFFERSCAVWENGQFMELADRTGFDCRKYQDKILRGDNGFMVPVRDVEALVIALRQYVEHLELAAEHGKWSRHYAEKYYDVRKVNQRMLEILGLGKGS